MKKVLLLLAGLIIVVSYSFAQDSADTSGSGAAGGFPLPVPVGIAITIVLALYELVIRYIPTAKNWSVLGHIIRFLQWLSPNKSSTGTPLP